MTNFVPVDFTLDIVWGAGTFCIGAFKFHDELHLNGVTQTGNTGLTFTHNGIQRIFFHSMFATIHSTTFANSGSTRYDLYFRGDVPGGIADTSYSPGNRSLLHLPGGNATWETWLASNARAFTSTDVATFETKFPGFAHPAYVVTAGKFNGGYATWWNAAPGITVTSASGVGAGEITPAYGEYSNLKTGTQMAFSAPERVEEDGVSFLCEGYTLETAGASWDDATSETFSGVRSFTLTADTAKAYRVTWLWTPEVSASVTVTSDKGTAFGSPDPGYGTHTTFTNDTCTFRATTPGYEPETGKRYGVDGYRLTANDGTKTHHSGQEFVYTTDMGLVTLEWLWTVNGYKLTTAAAGHLDVTAQPSPDAQGYGDIGSVSLAAVDGAAGTFHHWSGNIAGIDSYARSVEVDLVKPLTLLATPSCPWRFTGSALTNAIGWSLRASGGDSGISLGQDCPRVGPAVPWNLDENAHLLDLSLPIISDLTGNDVHITQSGNVPFRWSDGQPLLAKLVLPTTYTHLNLDSEIFGGQSKLKEIVPAPFPVDMTAVNSTLYFGAVPYRGDLFLLSPAIKWIGNCGIKFTHQGTQNIYFGKGSMGFDETAFSWSYANYRLWFQNFPTVPSSRNGSGDYRFYVQPPRGDLDWEAYLEDNARAFRVDDQAAFAARFPEDAALGNWPKFVFTSGFFSGTWAKQHGQVETIMIIR